MKKPSLKNLVKNCIAVSNDIASGKVIPGRGKFLEAITVGKNGRPLKKAKSYPVCAVGHVLYRCGYGVGNYGEGLSMWESMIGEENRLLLSSVYKVNDTSDYQKDKSKKRLKAISSSLAKVCKATAKAKAAISKAQRTT